MKKKVLITGGAGFIGSHVADELLQQGYEVRALDNLSEQVHGSSRKRPEYLHPDVELQLGDVRDPEAMRVAVEGVDAVFHLAAMVGVGQSMYQIKDYTEVNNLGTAVLLEALMKHPVEKLVIASSMSIYGEGLYSDSQGSFYTEVSRDLQNLKKAQWELYNEQGDQLRPEPTPESKKPDLSSIYALSKYDQERLCLIAGKAYNIPTTALRFFNVYGTRQALSNPYTGVLAIFASRLLNNNPPMIFEDGKQQRDFIHVKDVARACRLAMEVPSANGEVFNIGSGHQYSIEFIANKLAAVMGKKGIKAEITGKYRLGDIRHCVADTTKVTAMLGFKPKVQFEEGLSEMATWLETQIATDNVNKASLELSSRGLTV